MSAAVLICGSATGAVSGVRSPKFDFRELGKATVERVSDIVWQEAEQKYGVQFKRGPMVGRLVRYGDLAIRRLRQIDLVDAAEPLLFEFYETAVQAEVEILHHAQQNGEAWALENPIG